VGRLEQSFDWVQVFDMHELDAAPDGLSYGIRRGEMVFFCGKRQSSGLNLSAEVKDTTTQG
jgi:hypothetical protein